MLKKKKEGKRKEEEEEKEVRERRERGVGGGLLTCQYMNTQRMPTYHYVLCAITCINDDRLLTIYHHIVV